jgi:hypothetical protein
MLIEIIYPVDELVDRRMTAPTFLEGGFSDIYCSTSIDNWGRTIDLETYKSALPEAIHCSVSFGKGFSLRYLGMANSLKPSCRPFSQELSQSWTADSKSKLGTHINELLQ